MTFPRPAVLALVLLAGCSHAAARPNTSGASVVATTSTLASLAVGVVGDPSRVRSLVPVGASPEDYQPAPQDIEAIHAADVLVENGVNLEGWLQGDLDNARNAKLTVVVCADGLPVRDENPHLWMDPEFARAYVRKIRDGLVAADPANAAAYRRNASAYDAQLVALVSRTRRKLAAIPPPQRTMIIYHNAFLYYNARFGLRTIGVIELHPGAEPSPDTSPTSLRWRARITSAPCFPSRNTAPSSPRRWRKAPESEPSIVCTMTPWVPIRRLPITLE